MAIYVVGWYIRFMCSFFWFTLLPFRSFFLPHLVCNLITWAVESNFCIVVLYLFIMELNDLYVNFFQYFQEIIVFFLFNIFKRLLPSVTWQKERFSTGYLLLYLLERVWLLLVPVAAVKNTIFRVLFAFTCCWLLFKDIYLLITFPSMIARHRHALEWLDVKYDALSLINGQWWRNSTAT